MYVSISLCRGARCVGRVGNKIATADCIQKAERATIRLSRWNSPERSPQSGWDVRVVLEGEPVVDVVVHLHAHHDGVEHDRGAEPPPIRKP